MLRPGGLFAFSHHTPIESIAWPLDGDQVTDRFVVDYFGMHRLDDGETTTFQLPYGEWIRLFHENGFEIVEDLLEPRPAGGGRELIPGRGGAGWARRWPAEEIWRVRKR